MPLLTPGRRPEIPEVRDYYSRPDILNELLQGMQRWHVRYVPGYERQRWLYTECPAELQQLLNRALDTMVEDPQYTDYPYFRINYARYTPAQSWDEENIWGHDFVIEKDSPLWQECFEAMLPVMDILEYFGVHYWLKYSGHHSLHLVIPAEMFPSALRGISLNTCYESLHHRLMIFLNRHSNQHFNEHNRHCPPGTNMPYSINEDTGLVNLPLLRQDLAAFRPWHANIHLVEPRDFWRTIPDKSRGSGISLLEEVLKPTTQQKHFYTDLSQQPQFDEGKAQKKVDSPRVKALCLPGNQAFSHITSTDTGERCLAAWTLMVLALPETVPHLIQALSDENADVRWFAAEGLIRVGSSHALDDMLAMQPDDMAGSCLVDFCMRYGEVTIPALIQALCTSYRSPHNSLPFDKALEHIGEPSIPYLKDLQIHKNPTVRKVAATVLWRLTGTPGVEEVLVLSEQRNRKPYAASMLGWYDDPRVYNRVSELSADMHNDRLRRECIKSLLWNDHPHTKDLLHKALEDPSKKIRNWAKRYLALLKQVELLIIA